MIICEDERHRTYNKTVVKVVQPCCAIPRNKLGQPMMPDPDARDLVVLMSYGNTIGG